VRCGENRYLYPFLFFDRVRKDCDGVNYILKRLAAINSDFNGFGEKRVILAVVLKSTIYKINRKCNKQAMFLL